MEEKYDNPQLTATFAGMMEELGNARLDTLPLQDHQRRACGSQQKAALATAATNNAVAQLWANAINAGNFDDGEAHSVKGLDDLGGSRIYAKEAKESKEGVSMVAGKSRLFTGSSKPFPGSNKKSAPRTQARISAKVGALGGLIPDGGTVLSYGPSRRASGGPEASRTETMSQVSIEAATPIPTLPEAPKIDSLAPVLSTTPPKRNTSPITPEPLVAAGAHKLQLASTIGGTAFRHSCLHMLTKSSGAKGYISIKIAVDSNKNVVDAVVVLERESRDTKLVNISRFGAVRRAHNACGLIFLTDNRESVKYVLSFSTDSLAKQCESTVMAAYKALRANRHLEPIPSDLNSGSNPQTEQASATVTSVVDIASEAVPSPSMAFMAPISESGSVFKALELLPEPQVADMTEEDAYTALADLFPDSKDDIPKRERIYRQVCHLVDTTTCTRKLNMLTAQPGVVSVCKGVIIRFLKDECSISPTTNLSPRLWSAVRGLYYLVGVGALLKAVESPAQPTGDDDPLPNAVTVVDDAFKLESTIETQPEPRLEPQSVPRTEPLVYTAHQIVGIRQNAASRPPALDAATFLPQGTPTEHTESSVQSSVSGSMSRKANAPTQQNLDWLGIRPLHVPDWKTDNADKKAGEGSEDRVELLRLREALQKTLPPPVSGATTPRTTSQDRTTTEFTLKAVVDVHGRVTDVTNVRQTGGGEESPKAIVLRDLETALRKHISKITAQSGRAVEGLAGSKWASR